MIEGHVANNAGQADDLFSVADRQAGYFTAAEALALGYTYPLQSYHKARGHWLDAGWGLYRLRDYPHTDDEELVRLSLWSRDQKGKVQAIVSHDTALRLYELSDLLPSKVHLTVPKTFRKAAPEGVVLHKAALEQLDSRAQGAFRVTTPLRTLLDIADSNLSPEHLESAVGEALGRGLVRRKVLVDAMSRLPLGSESRSRLEQVQQIQREEVPEGVNMATWPLAWCLQHPAVSCVIPGCKTVEQVEANARAADLDITRADHPQALA